LDRIVEDKDLLIVVHELASVVINHPDINIAKHMSCLIREDIKALVKPLGETVIVCAALTEKEDGEFIINRILKLDTPKKRFKFLQRYIQLYLRAFATPVFKYGFTFEAHLQNVLARFKPNPQTGEYELIGFAVRDFGGVKLHETTLFSTTGLRPDVYNEKQYALGKDLEDVHQIAYHTMFQNHLHRIIRALGYHYCGEGWRIVRQELEDILPENSETYRMWLQTPTAAWKCFITMRLNRFERQIIFKQVPNLILFKGNMKIDY